MVLRIKEKECSIPKVNTVPGDSTTLFIKNRRGILVEKNFISKLGRTDHAVHGGSSIQKGGKGKALKEKGGTD